MPCGAKEASGVYRPRHPHESPFYKLVERFYPQFEAVYEERYQERYGFWRPIIGTVVRKFLECGDLKYGFARVRCPKCREEFFLSIIAFIERLQSEVIGQAAGCGERVRPVDHRQRKTVRWGERAEGRGACIEFAKT